MKTSLSSRFSPRALWLAAGLALAAGGLAWSVTASTQAGKAPEVSIKIDEQPIRREDHPQIASFAPIVKRVAPSVVKVSVVERSRAVNPQDLPPFFNDPMFRFFFGDPEGPQGGARPQLRRPPQEGLGSGVIVSKDGYILTNNHVVQGADVIKVSLADGRELTAKLVGTDPQSDLAVIKVDVQDLPAITFADSTQVEVGDRVLAIGNPFGIGQTVTSGMVSAVGRATFGLDYEDFIQTDAAINPGNSGGALVDVEGRLVGINTAILSRSGGFQGIGFAIPSELARSVMQQLVQNGQVVRGYLGVSIQDLNTELADAFKLEQRSGALVADVVPGSPAAAAGLKSGDVITEINRRPVPDARRLKLAVGSLAPDTEVPVRVVREGEAKELTLKIGKQPRSGTLASRGPNAGPTQDEGTLNGVGVANLDPRLRREFNIPANIGGVLITEVRPDSAAAVAGLQPGDVIQEINRRPVRDVDEAVRLTEAPESQRTLVRVWSQRGVRYVVVDETAESPAR